MDKYRIKMEPIHDLERDVIGVSIRRYDEEGIVFAETHLFADNEEELEERVLGAITYELKQLRGCI